MKLCTLFHSVSRDSDYFGTIEDDIPKLSTKQHINVICEAISDIFICLSTIIQTNLNGVFEYALWYLKKNRTHNEENEYGRYIAQITCNCIIQNSFSGTNSFDLVEFKGLK